MAATVRASQIGLQAIDIARKKKSWKKTEQAWCDLAMTSAATLKRCWRGEAIQQEAFAGICQAVGIQDWQSIADFSPSPPNRTLSSTAPIGLYNSQTWIERSELTEPLLQVLRGPCRVIAFTGITGIGKTEFAGRLVSELGDDKRFCRLNLDEGGISTDFASSGAALLRALGEEPTLEDQKDARNLRNHLVEHLRTHPNRVQIDSLERLLEGNDQDGWSEFVDPLWQEFFQQVLAGNECQSQLLLTTQDLPASLEAVGSRYAQVWHCEAIRGLSPTEQLALFAKRGLEITGDAQDYLSRIGRLYDGHPLVLRVIAEDLKACGGDVQRYWQQGKFAELEANRPAELSRRKLQLEVKRRVKESFARLTEDARQLLCRSSVFRRPVPEAFWLAMLPERPEPQAALNLLKSRALAEEDWQPGAWLGADDAIPLRQHNLIRSVAYELLEVDQPAWEIAERKAAELWLTSYESVPDAPNLEKVRGYLEAFEHYCEVEDWEAAIGILETNDTPDRRSPLWFWLQLSGSYKEQIKLLNRISGKVSPQLEIKYLLTWQLLSMHQQMLKTPYLLDKSAFRLHSLLLLG